MIDDCPFEKKLTEKCREKVLGKVFFSSKINQNGKIDEITESLADY
jgi:hypothetical protein